MKQNKISQNIIHSEMTVLDIVSAFQSTVAVFKKWDDKAGECICCNALFDSLIDVAENYGLDLDELLSDLNKTVEGSGSKSCM
jgi:hypothetical protein